MPRNQNKPMDHWVYHISNRAAMGMKMLSELKCCNRAKFSANAPRTLTAPVFLALTFLVSLMNTLRHVAKTMSRGGLLLMNPGIDSNLVATSMTTGDFRLNHHLG